MKTYLAITVFLFTFYICKASHFIGSQLTYGYVAETAEGMKYRLKLTIGRDCTPGTPQLPDNIQLGIYDAQSGKLVKKQELGIALRTRVETCNLICMEENLYTDIIVLPRNSNGYLVMEQHCCRNYATNTLNTDQGAMAWCQIPPTAVVNSAPYFADGEGYFLTRPGLADTMELIPYDPDGDSMSIEFVKPLAGGSLDSNFPAPPNAFPGFHPVDFNAGYDINPLGPSSTFKVVDAKNGLIAIQCNTAGTYEVAYAIKEFRNGVLLGMTTKESIIVVDDAVDMVSQAIKLNGVQSGSIVSLHWEILCRGKSKVQYLQRSTDSIYNYRAIDSFAPGVTSRNDSTISVGHTYFYRIRSIIPAGWAFFSNVIGINYYSTGADEIYKVRLNISPVPVKDVCEISVSSSSITLCTVIDATGRSVLISQPGAPAATHQIDCSNLPSGIYTIQVITANGSHLNRRIVKE